MPLWTRPRSIAFAVALFLTATPYVVAYADAVWKGGFLLTYQTEMTSHFTYSEHIWIGRLLYGALCLSLIFSGLCIERRKWVALIALAIALPILVNDGSAALFDFFSLLPWVPKGGQPFESFYNELKIPEKVWYCMVAVVAAAAAYCVAGSFAARRSSASAP